MRVGIIGHRGFVGSAFFSCFSEDKKYSVAGIERDNYAQSSGSQFDVLINCNGNSSKRLADSEPEKDWEMNVASTARFLQDFPCRHYVHLSTVEVYNDKADRGKCSEDSAIDQPALSNYGKSKCEGEKIARAHKSFLILRLAGMVGKNMKKGPAYDILELGRLFISEKSRLHFLDTSEVAGAAKRLIENGRWNETYNLVGKGAVGLSEFAKIAGIKLSAAGSEKIEFDIPTEKIERELALSTSEETVRRFVGEWKKGKG